MSDLSLDELLESQKDLRFKLSVIIKYRNSPYYKGSDLWNNLPRATIECDTIFELKMSEENRPIVSRVGLY